MFTVIDEALTWVNERTMVTVTEFTDTLLDIRHGLMKGNNNGSVPLETHPDPGTPPNPSRPPNRHITNRQPLPPGLH